MAEEVQIGEVLELDRDYAVVASVWKDKFQYVFLVSCEEPIEVKFGKIIPNGEEIDLIVVHNQAEKLELMDLFRDSMSNMLESGELAEILQSLQ